MAVKDNNTVVILKLDRPRVLKFGHKAMKRWSAYTGRSVSDINPEEMTMEEIEVLLYFMLIQDAEAHGEDLKMESLEDLLDDYPLGNEIDAINRAIMAAFPEQAAKLKAHEKNAKRAAAGTGTKP